MGLIRAALDSVGGVLADQWLEYFFCESLDETVLMKKGEKRVGGRNSNKKGHDNVISNGSAIEVNEGQCMIIVDSGEIVEVCAEAGIFRYDSSSEPSIFYGNLKQNIVDTFKTMGNRIKFGGDAAKNQRVYYINTKEILDNKFGTINPIPFKVVINEELGYKLSVDIRCNGLYTYQITNPLNFYKKIAANVADEYLRENLDSTLKSELLDALQPALAKISAKKISYDEIPAHTIEIKDALNEVLGSSWVDGRGIEIVRLSLNSLTIPEDQRKKITEWEETAMATNPLTLGANVMLGQKDAAKIAAGNTAGAVTGFMGMGAMGMGMGGMGVAQNAANIFSQGYQQQQQQQQTAAPSGWKCACGATVNGNFCPTCGAKKPEPQPAGDSWQCSCGTVANGKFCPNCGAKKPEVNGWTCACGAVNQGKFCPNCGAKKPEGAPLFRCDKCGWQPEDPHNPPKFCPECGDIFDSNDIN